MSAAYKTIARRLGTCISLVIAVIATFFLIDDISLRITIRAGNRIVEKIEAYHRQKLIYPNPETVFVDIGLVPISGLGGAATEIAGKTFFYSGGGEYFSLLTGNGFDESFEYNSYSEKWISIPFYKSGNDIYPLAGWRIYILFIIEGISLLLFSRRFNSSFS